MGTDGLNRRQYLNAFAHGAAAIFILMVLVSMFFPNLVPLDLVRKTEFNMLVKEMNRLDQKFTDSTEHHCRCRPHHGVGAEGE